MFNVLAYGAKCDGSTDDSTALANAAAAAELAGGILLIPPQANGKQSVCVFSTGLSYIINSTTPEPFMISGYGQVLKYTGSGTAISVTQGTTFSNIPQQQVTMLGFALKQAGTGTIGIDLSSSSSQSLYDPTIRDVFIIPSDGASATAFSTAAIRIGSQSSNPQVNDVHLEDITISHPVIGLQILKVGGLDCHNCFIYDAGVAGPSGENVLVGDSTHAAVNIDFTGDSNVENDANSAAKNVPSFVLNNVEDFAYSGYSETYCGNFLQIPNTATLAVNVNISRLRTSDDCSPAAATHIISVNLSTATLTLRDSYAKHYAANSMWVQNTSASWVWLAH